MKTPDIARHFSQEDATFTMPSWDLVALYGDMRFALLYSAIFFPEFIEVEDSILLADYTDGVRELFSDAKKTTKLSLAELEASFNFVEVAYMFRRDDITDDAIEIKLAHIIVDAWQDRLKRLYPSRVFSVSVLDPSVSGSVYSVEFFEIR